MFAPKHRVPTILSLFALSFLSCSTPGGSQLPEDSSLWPTPTAFKAAQGLTPGKVSVEVLNTSETIPSPRWLAIDSKDRLYATVGNGHDSTLYAVDTNDGQVSKYKSGALDMPAITLKKMALPIDSPPYNKRPTSFVEVNVSHNERYQLTPTITIDSKDNVFTLIPYIPTFFGKKVGWQLHKINTSAHSMAPELVAEKRTDQDFSIQSSDPGAKDVLIDTQSHFVITTPYHLLSLSKTGLAYLEFSTPSIYISIPTYIYAGLTGIHQNLSKHLWVTSNEVTLLGDTRSTLATFSNTGIVSTFNFQTSLEKDLPNDAIFIDITSDESEHLYVTESKHGVVYKVWPQEQRAEVIANSQDGLETPIGMAWDSKGNLYVADATKNQIFVIKPKENQS